MVKDFFFSAIEDRRSYYSLARNMLFLDKRIKEVIDHAVQYSPSAFNSQSARVIVLTGQSHDQLWDITKETLRKAADGKDFTKNGRKNEIIYKWLWNGFIL